MMETPKRWTKVSDTQWNCITAPVEVFFAGGVWTTKQTNSAWFATFPTCEDAKDFVIMMRHMCMFD